jgi:phosphoglycolate phosphatase
MAAPLRLVVFDVDGTLVDSQADIVGAMTQAFELMDMSAPDRGAILNTVGLSLPDTMHQLIPQAGAAVQEQLVAAYKQAYSERRQFVGSKTSSPMYVGARAALERLWAVDDILLGVATGKSRRGLNILMDGHDLHSFFVTTQVSDTHPSKPHPSMVLTALSEVGVEACNAVVVGDTSYDMAMARAAGVDGIGVTWGYHPADALGDAAACVETFDALLQVLSDRWEIAI